LGGELSWFKDVYVVEAAYGYNHEKGIDLDDFIYILFIDLNRILMD